MPYIKTDDREKIDPLVESLAKVVRSTEKVDGAANYTVTRFLLQVLRPVEGWNYASLMRVIGTLECVKLEICRRLINSYEDLAVYNNGDLPEFECSLGWEEEIYVALEKELGIG